MTGCAHSRIEPVELATGEVVAAVCALCLVRLSSRALACRRLGGHEEAVEVTSLGSAVRHYLCGRCGRLYGEEPE